MDFQKKPTKGSIKPIDYMYPVDNLEDPMENIDLVWYKDMIENYVMGAFGLSAAPKQDQRSLSTFFEEEKPKEKKGKGKGEDKGKQITLEDLF